MNKVFTPEVSVLGTLRGCYPIGDLAQETSVYAASPDFVRKHCGPIANQILAAVPEHYFAKCAQLGMLPNIDVRIHRLNQGEYPAVPGWHCDGALRETYFAAPQIGAVPVRDTVVCAVSSDPGGVSNLEYLTKPFEVPTPKDSWSWKTVHRQIMGQNPPAAMSQDGVLYQMGADSLHRVSPARVRGWRLFFRMSMWHNPYLGDEGQVATQQQVYVLSEDNGW